MKLASVFSPLAIACSLLLTASEASAQSRLGQAADSLEDSLKSLNKQFDRRGDRFQDSAGSLYRVLDKTRTDSDRLAKESSQNKPKWQLQPKYDDLRKHMNDLAEELDRYSLSREERRAADAVRWNYSLTVSAWDRYGVTMYRTYPTLRPEPFTDTERARTYATRFLARKYGVSAKYVDLGGTADLGRIVRVRATVRGVGKRLVDVDSRSGAILADRRG